MKTIIEAFNRAINPPPHQANSVLWLIFLLWGLPSLAMLLVPAYKWQAEGTLSVGWFSCSVFGLILQLAYVRFAIAFIGKYNGDNWLREQLFGEDEDDRRG